VTRALTAAHACWPTVHARFAEQLVIGCAVMLTITLQRLTLCYVSCKRNLEDVTRIVLDTILPAALNVTLRPHAQSQFWYLLHHIV
jgi:hypothetical protein